MNFVASTAERTVNGVGITDNPAGLSTFLQPGCAAAIWRRQMPDNIRAWLEGLDPELLPKGRVVLPANAVAGTVQHLCDMAGLPDGDERAWLQSDIISLAGLFSSLLQVKYLRLRLDVVTNNACRKFHVDAIKARLVCTYRGTGTQYGVSKDGNDPKRVFTTPAGAPILLRGSLWPESPATGLRHRSPPIEGTGETRLLLVLDPIFDLDEE